MKRSWTTAILVVGGSGLLAAPSLLGGCTGDEFTSGGAGGDASAPTSTPASAGSGDTSSTGETTSTGASGDCSAGCIADDGSCHVEQSAAFCGLGAVSCTACGKPTGECQEAFCDGGACAVRNLPNLTPCSDGGCFDGECRADVEVCLNDADEDDDGKTGCADRDCTDAGYGCLDGESQFEGPWLVVAGSAAASCPNGIEPEGVLYTVPLDESFPCGCGLDVECGVTLTKVLAAACNDAQGDEVELVADEATCTAFETSEPLDALSVGERYCTASEPAPDEGDVTTLTMCPLEAHGCDQNDGCAPPVPRPSGDGENLLCIFVDGELQGNCPGGWPIRRAASTSPEVDCECDCTLPDGACVGEITTWSNAGCNECANREGDEPCQSASVPPDANNCYGVAVGAEYARFQRTDDVEIVPTHRATYADGIDRTLCCKAYPLEE